jgi:hypothetical protein
MPIRRDAFSYPVIVLCVGLAALLLRLSAHTMLHFPWPPGTDHFIYYEMAHNSLLGKGPVLDFVYSYLTIPPQITHMEDYYEPLYGWLCGLLMGKETYAGSVRLPFLASLGQLIAIFGLTFALARKTFQQSTQTAAQSALLALTLLAVHPLFIQRSASLMKESVMGCVYLLFALGVLFLWDHKDSALGLSLACFGIGLLQYESLPILFLSVALTLILQKRWLNLSVFTASFGVFNGVYAYWLHHHTGLWLSTKFYFLTSAYDGASFDKPRPFAIQAFISKAQRALGYISRRSIYVLGLPGLSMAGLSLFLKDKKQPHSYLLWCFNFLIVYLGIHGLAVDLRPQDYMVIWCLGIPFVACVGGEISRKQVARPTFLHLYLPAFALLYTVCYGLLNASGFIERYFFYPLWHTTQIIPFGLTGLIFYALKQKHAEHPLFLKARQYAVVCWFPLVVYGFTLSLGYADIYENAEQERFLAEQALPMFVQHHLKDAVLLVSDPYAMHYFTQRPTLKLTERKYIAHFKPTFSVGLSETALREKGFESHFFHRIQNLEIRRLKP